MSDSLEKVLVVGDDNIFMLVKLELNRAGIEYSVMGENLQNMTGLGIFRTGLNLVNKSIVLLVKQKDADVVREIVSRIMKSKRKTIPLFVRILACAAVILYLIIFVGQIMKWF